MSNSDWDRDVQRERFELDEHHEMYAHVIRQVRELFKDTADELMDMCPRNREAFVALNHLETSFMYAVKAVVR